MTMKPYRDLPKALRFVILLFALLPTMALVTGCGSSANVGQSTDTSRRQNARVATAGSVPRAVVTAPPASSVALSALVDSLRRLSGAFTQSPAKVWLFSGDPSVFSTLFDRGDSAVVALVNCIDRPELAAATVDGKRVALGVMCATALLRIASAIEYEDSGDWAGIIKPTATHIQLQDARKEWEKVIAKRSYRLL